MSVNGIAQIVFYLAVLTALTPPLGAYMARVFEGRRVPGLTRVLGPVERGTYRLLRIDPEREQAWKGYTTAVLAFSVAGFAVLYAILRLQGHLPLNPNGYPGMSWNVAFNTAASFITNTNWQYYGGEATLSYLSQTVGLTVQNFLSAAVGMAVLAAVIRGFARRGTGALGNFWVDLVRITLYILLPIAIVVTLILGSQGVIQTFSDPVSYQTLEARTLGVTDASGQPATQSIYRGAVASQIAIKQLGTNGGGYYNTNSAMPFENPTGLTNFVEVLLILLIPAALTYTFGLMVGSRGQGWALFATMMVVLVDRPRRGPALRAAGLPGAQADRRRAVGHGPLERRQHERQGGALRRRQLGPLGNHDHGRLQRIGQQRPGRVDRRRRGGAPHPARHGGGGVRRDRIRHVRDAAVRPRRGLRGRADGGAHPGVPRPQDRGQGGEAGHDRVAGDARRRARDAVGGDRHQGGPRVGLQRRPPGLRRGLLRLQLAVQQQRERVRGLRGDRVLHDPRRRGDADRPLHPDPGDHGHRGRPVDQEGRADDGRARCARPRPPSW